MEQKRNSAARYLFFAIGGAILIALPFFVTNSYYQVIINKVLINAVAVLGLNYITGLVGQMNVGTAGMFALGAYSYSLFATKLPFSPWFGVLLALVIGCLVGILLGYPSLRVSGIYLVFTTLSFSEIVRMLLTNLRDFTGGATGVRQIPELSLFGLTFGKYSKEFYFFLLFVLVVCVLVANRLIKSKWGRAFKAVRDNPDSAETCGIRISSIKVGAFVLAAVYTCLAGSLYAMLAGYISPDEYTGILSIRYIMMLMVGGIGTIGGCIMGAGVVTALPELLRGLGNYYWITFCTVVLVCAIFTPNGLYSLIILLKDLAKKLIEKLFVKKGVQS